MRTVHLGIVKKVRPVFEIMHARKMCEIMESFVKNNEPLKGLMGRMGKIVNQRSSNA